MGAQTADFAIHRLAPWSCLSALSHAGILAQLQAEPASGPESCKRGFLYPKILHAMIFSSEKSPPGSLWTLHSITIFVGSKSISGNCGFMSFRVSSRICVIRSFLNHLWSAGMMYQGAVGVLVALSVSS